MAISTLTRKPVVINFNSIVSSVPPIIKQVLYFSMFPTFWSLKIANFFQYGRFSFEHHFSDDLHAPILDLFYECLSFWPFHSSRCGSLSLSLSTDQPPHFKVCCNETKSIMLQTVINLWLSPMSASSALSLLFKIDTTDVTSRKIPYVSL